MRIPWFKSWRRRYNRLFVLRLYLKDGVRWAKCRCDCGNICRIRLNAIRQSYTRSCGCLNDEMRIETGKITGKINIKLAIKKSIEVNTLHREGNSVEGKIWYDMMSRCYNPKNKRYNCYGARGIEVHKPWRSKSRGLIRFIRWLLSDEGIGRRPVKPFGIKRSRYSIDRIDNDGSYEPGNLKWATSKQQANNRSSCIIK